MDRCLSIIAVVALVLVAWSLDAAEPSSVPVSPGSLQQIVTYSMVVDQGDPATVPCVLSFPKGYAGNDLTQQWPLILFLHGAGTKDVEQVRGDVINTLAREHPEFPFVVVSPWSKRGWRPALVKGVLDQVLVTCRVDPNRVYLTGASMGGQGSWSTAATYPERFTAVVPICGGGDLKTAGRLKDLPIWAFHGDKDDLVPVRASADMVAAVQAAGGTAKITVYEGVGHGSWGPAYNTLELYEWLLSHRRQGNAVIEQPVRESDSAIRALQGMRAPMTMTLLWLTQHLADIQGQDPANGLSFSLPVQNLLENELKILLEWDRKKNPAWQVTSEKGGPEELTLKPGEEAVLRFVARNTDAKALFPLPACKVRYTCGALEKEREFRVPMDIDAYLSRNRPRLTVHSAVAPPTIDGKLDDPAWKRPPDVTGFVHPDLQDQPLVRTQAWIAYDADHLYVAMQCEEPFMERLVATRTDRDDEVWNDDCIEVFIDPQGQRQDYYQFIVNTKEAVYDSHRMDRSFSADVRAAAGRQADGFVIEVTIPWSALAVREPVKGKTMSFLLARDRQPKGVEGTPAANRQNTSLEVLQYPPVNGWNHRKENYGDLKLD